MKEYKTVGNNMYPTFIKDMNAALSEGWQPCGGISVIYIPTSVPSQGLIAGFYYAQALVR